MLNIRRILFPTDFSEGARQAFAHAASLADWHDAELHILNVTERRRQGRDEAPTLPASLATLTDWFVASGGETQVDLKALPIVQEQVESEAPPERIVAYVEDVDVDLVAMGTHGRRGINRMLFGSVTEEVVRKTPCPVLTVRTGADASPKQAVRRILVPVDFSEAAEMAIQHAKEIAFTYGAEIDLLHVVEEVVYPSTYGIDPGNVPAQADIFDRVETHLGAIAREEIGYEHVMVEAVLGHPPTAILEYVEDRDVDLVVLATHGRTGLDRVLIGSVAERVIRQSPVPVFSVKPDRKSLVSLPGVETTGG